MSEIVINARDPELLARFWSDVLGFVELSREGDGAIEIGPASGFGGPQPTLVFGPVAEPAPGRLRLHFDVNPTDGDQEQELARLLALGARHADVGQTGEEDWYVLADPEDNEFCLLRRRLDQV
jgi:catechol 2,3-dioxygenase-like lactoylglutathione lyase family enzyme